MGWSIDKKNLGRALLAAAATGALACGNPQIVTDDAARALAKRHVDADRLGTLQSTHPSLTLAMAKIGDPWTRLITVDGWKAFNHDVTYKTAVGLGLPELLSVDLDVRGYQVQIVDPLPGSPAERAGLKTGDLLETIDGKPAQDLKWNEVMASLRVPEGQTVELGVRNRQDGLRTIKVKSEKLTPPALVEGQATGPSSAVIQVRGFTDRTAQEISALLDSLQPSELELDLRNNPGGSLSAMLAVAGLFVGAQPVLAMRTANAAEDTLNAVGEKRYTGTLTVRVNEGSASAAEALAVGLRYAKRTSIVGRKTFGKCLVHDAFMLSDGRALLMTIGRLHAPGQRPWCSEGVAPDTPG